MKIANVASENSVASRNFARELAPAFRLREACLEQFSLSYLLSFFPLWRVFGRRRAGLNTSCEQPSVFLDV